jgi:hypothetical protein
MRKLLPVLLLLPCFASAELFYRANGATSVTIGDICVPVFSGETFFALDFDTTNLTIKISAQGDGVDTVFTYTAGDIDDYDGTPPDWGAPPASAIEVEAQDDGCVKLHIRDEVFAVTGATEWSIRFLDSTTDAIMDWHVQVLDLADEDDFETSVTAALTAFGTATETNVTSVGTLVQTADNAIDAVAGDVGGLVTTIGTPVGDDISGDIATAQADLDNLADAALGTFLNCEVNTANFAGSTTTLACILTDLNGGAVTQATGDLEGLQIVVTSGAQIREARFINDTTWDGANSELQLQLSRALPGTLADAVTVVIR